MYNIVVIGFDNCLGSSITSFIDLFKIANMIWKRSKKGSRPLFSWKFLSNSEDPIHSFSGLKMKLDGRLSSQKADIVFVPAYYYVNDRQVMNDAAEVASWAGDYLNTQYKQGALIATACNGAFILAEAGIMENRTTTTSWWLSDLYSKNFPATKVLADQSIIVDERIFAAGSFIALFDLALKLMEVIAGHHVAMLCMRYISINSDRTAQVSLNLHLQIEHNDERISQAQFWMQVNLHKSFDIGDVAKAVNLGLRTFVRRFKSAVNKSPIQYLQDVRVDVAKLLLETSDLTLDQILNRIGYTDANSFRRLFKQKCGLSVKDYRKMFKRKTEQKDTLPSG